MEMNWRGNNIAIGEEVMYRRRQGKKRIRILGFVHPASGTCPRNYILLSFLSLSPPILLPLMYIISSPIYYFFLCSFPWSKLTLISPHC